MLLDAEFLKQQNRKTGTRLRSAKLRIDACLEDLKVKSSRGLDRTVITSLATCDWIRDKRNILITGATGAGKTYLACAVANAACRQGFTTVYYRTSTLFDDLVLGRADGRYKKILAPIENKKLLVLDDFGLSTLTAENRRDLLEKMEQRYDLSSTIITSQFDVDLWHDIIGDPTLADAILDRTVHNAHKLKVKGPSIRKEKSEELGK